VNLGFHEHMKKNQIFVILARVSGIQLWGFAPEAGQDCSGGESLATCGRFDRLSI